jgi:hypothetical protein
MTSGWWARGLFGVLIAAAYVFLSYLAVSRWDGFYFVLATLFIALPTLFGLVVYWGKAFYAASPGGFESDLTLFFKTDLLEIEAAKAHATEAARARLA